MEDTHFAPAEKTDNKELTAEIEIVNNNPVVSGLLHSISGLIAVIDEHRQIIAVNDSFLKVLGIDDAATVLGLRPGEALQCVHSEDAPAGCGTTRFCSTCGAAVAIVSSFGHGKPEERMCSLAAKRGDQQVNIMLLVRSYPMTIEDNKFLLLFLQDISQQQQRAALERTFFHDINNLIHVLIGASELLVETTPSKLANNIHMTATRLQKEVAIQRCLTQSESGSYLPVRRNITPDQVIAELQTFFACHPDAINKDIEFLNHHPHVSFCTDLSLVLRVLCNMVINALEATAENGRVRFWIEHDENKLTFCVWNAAYIPEDIAIRVFQRNFSTKEQAGRGIGTFSMKLFGEDILGGNVSFTTLQEEGTTFRFALPL